LWGGHGRDRKCRGNRDSCEDLGHIDHGVPTFNSLSRIH
jgi:hypothetical protein